VEFRVRDLLGPDGMGGPRSTALENTTNVKLARELRSLGSLINTTVLSFSKLLISHFIEFLCPYKPY
jgi:hypothetical protein